jgi:mRNA interferase RelE/StbE
MTYELNFTPSAKKEWDKLDNSVKQMFKKALAKRLINPIVPVSKLRDLPIDCYKIKLRTIGYRLVYTIENNKLILLV